MKHLTTYLFEALKNDVQKWLKQVFDGQQKLIKSNRIQKNIIKSIL